MRYTPQAMASILALLVAPALACSYSEYSQYNYYNKNYNVCDGDYCSSDYYCQSNYCEFGTCASNLAPWAIFLITFFSVFIFLTIIRILVVCMRKRRTVILVRNQNLARQ